MECLVLKFNYLFEFHADMLKGHHQAVPFHTEPAQSVTVSGINYYSLVAPFVRNY